MKNRKRLITCILFIAFSVLTFSPVYASTTETTLSNTVLYLETCSTINTENDNQIAPYGLKKTVVVKALKYGGDLLAEIVDMIGDESIAKMLKDNAYAIGDFLDSITDSFEANLIQFMAFQLGFPMEAARNIAWAICFFLL